MSSVLLKNGRIIDPGSKRDEIGDVLVVNGRIADTSAPASPSSGIETIDCKGLVIAPGLIDIHVHLREPGQSAN